MSGKSQFALLKTERFLPLFVTQALSAFNDNAFRFAVAAIIISTIADKDQAGLMNTVSALLFVLPFFLFSATAGQLADKFDKAWLARRIKLIEIAIIALSAYSLFTDSIPLKQFCVFLAGLQAAFFGPIKYSILPQHLEKDELLGGNGMVEMATFLAVLLGTIFGNLIVSMESGTWLIATFMVGIGVFSYWTATRIPDAPSAQPDLKINPNIFGETWNAMKLAKQKDEVFQAILGISWFWFLGVVLVTQMQFFANDTLHGTPAVASLIFALFSIGIGAGSIFCNKLLNGVITARYVPISALLMSLFLFDIYFAGGSANSAIGASIANGTVAAEVNAAGDKLIGIAGFLSHWQSWRVIVDMIGIAFFSGLFVVPLFAIMQARTPYYQRARIIGANNIINALFMLVASALSVGLLAIGFTARGLFLTLAIANLGAAIYIIRILPHEVLASITRSIFRFFYQVEVKGLENYHNAGRKTLIVANHTSLLDGPLLSAFLPERAAFAINTQMAKKWWVKPAFALFDLCPIDPGNPLALRSLVTELKRGHRVVIFPEGRLTTTGGLMKIYEGPGAVAEMAGGRILPVRISGAQHSPFSRLKGKFPIRWFPKITVTFLPPVRMDSPKELRGSALREFQAEKLYDVMSDMVFRTTEIDKTLWRGILDAREVHGGKREIFEDIQRTPLTYNRLILGAFILGRKLAKLTPNQKNVGVLMPNANATVVAIFGLHAFGRVPAMLNFSTGAVNMSAACTAAQVQTIITSRKFIEAGEMEADIELLQKTCRIVYLEDVRESVKATDKLRGLWNRTFVGLSLKRAGVNNDPNSPAVILFTSGSEGLPKGVVLSHRNLISNCAQMMTRLPFTPQEIFFTALPLFHAFGFTSTVLTMNEGMRAFLYPSPLHYKIVPELVYDTQSTVLIATDTFLTGYARNAHPYDFQSLRYVVGGAEKVKPETRAIWMEKYGHRIIEGYGATECAPAIAANTPMHSKTGTVGRIFNGMEHRIEPVEGITEGGRLVIKGPNVMLGYLRADNPGVIEPPAEGWYDTGDIVTVDAMKYVTILGRAKRFCKIAGEMVSLTAVEAKIAKGFSTTAHAVVAVPDAKKGEQLVLFTTEKTLDRKALGTAMKAEGATELMIPKNIFVLDTLPVLGSGKTDYVTLNRMAREKVTE
jgi:acyl-[acyl-carrier-protein]-phospholipid O-acyltransferase / long-chain-fatty-acid--[acyl-carrier-protein] ligase